MKPSSFSPLAVAVDGLTIRYSGAAILDNVQLEVRHPSFCVIAGRNGAGKSTLLKALAGLAPTGKKEVSIFGGPAHRMARTSIAYLPERVQLIGHLTPLENAEYVLSLTSDGGYDAALVRHHFAALGLATAALEKPLYALSKGMAQRTALAIAFAKPHQLLLLDEPLSGLDKVSRQQVSGLLADHKAAGHTIVAVTHDIYSVAEASDQIVFMKDGAADRVLLREAAGRDFAAMLDACVDEYLEDLPRTILRSDAGKLIGALP